MARKRKMKRRFNIGAWAKKHPRKMAAARRKGRRARFHHSTRGLAVRATKITLKRPMGVFLRIFRVLKNHDDRLKVLENHCGIH